MRSYAKMKLKFLAEIHFIGVYTECQIF